MGSISHWSYSNCSWSVWANSCHPRNLTYPSSYHSEHWIVVVDCIERYLPRSFRYRPNLRNTTGSGNTTVSLVTIVVASPARHPMQLLEEYRIHNLLLDDRPGWRSVSRPVVTSPSQCWIIPFSVPAMVYRGVRITYVDFQFRSLHYLA